MNGAQQPANFQQYRPPMSSQAGVVDLTDNHQISQPSSQFTQQVPAQRPPQPHFVQQNVPQPVVQQNVQPNGQQHFKQQTASQGQPPPAAWVGAPSQWHHPSPQRGAQ